jgi:hypothetical protein
MITLSCDTALSAACRLRLAEAAAAIGERLLTGEPTALESPRLVVGTLRLGERRLGQTLLEASERWPGVPLLIACDEELVHPITRLHGGRVTLISQDLDQPRLRRTLRSCIQWLDSGEPVTETVPRPEPDGDGWWVRAVVSAHPSAPQPTIHAKRSCTAWLRPAPQADQPLPLAALDEWGRRALANHPAVPCMLLPPLPPAPGAGVHLDPAGIALMHCSGPGWQLVISSPGRLPAWCPLAPGTHHFATRSRDVLIAAWVPSGSTLPVLTGSGRAVATELTRLWHGQAAAAVIVEVR